MKEIMNGVNKIIGKKMKFLKRVVGAILLFTGESLLGINHEKYYLVKRIIENLLQNQDVAVKVQSTREEPLVVHFDLKVTAIEPFNISDVYFLRELQLQLGCKLSDMTISGKEKEYIVSITRTALDNLELGETPFISFAIHEEKLDPLNKANIEASKKTRQVN